MTDSTPTLTDEQRAQLKAALDREWPMPTLMDGVAAVVARMVADAEQRGRAEVSAAVEAVAEKWERTPQQNGSLAALAMRHINDLHAVLDGLGPSDG